ncbi:MAG: ABC transporter ATP-binding protein [Anaerolineaceae bacterium]|nr:ABC transporter ATP-binding protein [Anaerolineaceae bacterium]
MNEQPAIKIVGLKKSYGNIHALRGVNLEVKQGEIYGFLGPNGAGKTTTIRCMLDLIRPQEGSIDILGFDPQKQAVEVRSQVGYLPGELALEANVKVLDVLRYFAYLRGAVVSWDYIRTITKRLELDLDMPVKNLSKGNKQKVGLVQALIPQAKILLLDEPTAGLDPLMQQVVYKMLKEAQAQGTTIFFSSHIISEVEAIADRVAIIRKGIIAEEINPSQLASMTMRKVRVRFKHAVDTRPLAKLESIFLLSKGNGKEITLKVEGDMDKLVKALALYPVSNIETLHHSLEEVFLDYYKDEEREVC